MSKIVAQAVIRGSHEVFKQASDFLDKAIKEKGETQKIGFPEIETQQQLNLVLRAKKKVWMQVKSDGRVVFEDVLKKGDMECWLADDSIELWVGDGSVLELELNGKPIGSPGTGVIKNIIITRQGMKIGGK